MGVSDFFPVVFGNPKERYPGHLLSKALLLILKGMRETVGVTGDMVLGQGWRWGVGDHLYEAENMGSLALAAWRR